LDYQGFEENRLYLCPAVWGHPFLDGSSLSQVEVLLHELSHLVDSPAGAVTDWQHPACTAHADARVSSLLAGLGSLVLPFVDLEPRCWGYTNALYLASQCSGCATRNASNYAGFGFEATVRPALLTAIF
jgi:hypothetical protein